MASPPGEGGSESRVVTINVVYSDHVAERLRDLVAVELVMAFQDEGQFDEDMDGSFLDMCRCPRNQPSSRPTKCPPSASLRSGTSRGPR